jgi:hypothetical protein
MGNVRVRGGKRGSRVTTDAGEPLRSRRRRSFWVGMVGLAALVFVGIAAVLEMAPTAPPVPTRRPRPSVPPVR